MEKSYIKTGRITGTSTCNLRKDLEWLKQCLTNGSRKLREKRHKRVISLWKKGMRQNEHIEKDFRGASQYTLSNSQKRDAKKVEFAL